ncbi:MAG TPA: hypothetical protein VN690_00460 [Terriglobales bacterium]|nr:hypothetical protein [Terriglobales bacterium]
MAKSTPAAAKNAPKPAQSGTKATPAAAPKNGKKPPKGVAKSSAAAAPPAPKISKAEAEITGKILHLIAEEMTVEEAELTPNALLAEDMHLDGIDIAELLIEAESEFGLTPFSDADWEKCVTVDDFVTLVIKRIEVKRGKKIRG